MSESHDAVDENVVTEESRPTSPYIRPPIVVVSSANRRKFSLQCDYDVRKMLNVLNVCKILKEIWRELRNSIFSISSMWLKHEMTIYKYYSQTIKQILYP